jgi:hypothetical protein
MKLLIEGIDRNWDTTALPEVRKCCENYDQAQGCLFLKKCVAPKCRHYQEVVIKVAAIEGVHAEYQIPEKGDEFRDCPTCHGEVEKGHRFCSKCVEKRKRASWREASAKKRLAVIQTRHENATKPFQASILPSSVNDGSLTRPEQGSHTSEAANP